MMIGWSGVQVSCCSSRGDWCVCIVTGMMIGVCVVIITMAVFIVLVFGARVLFQS